MRIQAVLIALLSAAVALAGCSGGEAPAPEADFQDIGLEATKETGVLRGVVFDAAVTPIPGVAVTAKGPGDETRTTETNEAGLFGLDGLAPGTWFVTAEKPGFVKAQTGVEVVAGVSDPPITKLLLERDPALAPYIQSLVFVGFIECSFSVVLLRAAACSGVGNDQFLEEYTLDQPPAWLQSEMVWESTQSLGNEMQLSITDFSTDLQTRVNASAGPSPQYITVNETMAREFRFGVNNTVVLRVFNDAVDDTDVWPDEEAQGAYASSGFYGLYNGTPAQTAVGTAAGVASIPLGLLGLSAQDPFAEECVKWPTLFDACMGMGGVGATLQQEFTIYTHAFYQFTPAPGWRFSEDGDHPLPG